MATINRKEAPKRKTVESTFATKWNPLQKGDELEGTYLGSDKVNGRGGDSFVAYHIEDSEGKRWSAAGAHLDSIMPQIAPGTYVWVVFEGKTDTQSGPMNTFRVDVPEDVKLKDPYKSE